MRKSIIIGIAVIMTILTGNMVQAAEQTGKLQHVVSFKFKPGTSPADIEKIEKAFRALKDKIPQISALEWGTNNSPEKHDKGFTHCFILSFKSEKDREAYLPHPDHKEFGKVVGPHIADVFVIDFWAKN